MRSILSNDYADGYEKGSEDAWELARKIVMHTEDGGFTVDKLGGCFGMVCYFDILRDHTYEQAQAKVKEYEEKKNELIPGDVVRVKNRDGVQIDKAVVVYDSADVCRVISRVTAAIDIIRYTKTNYIISKTGEHIDIQPLLDVLKE